jgi:hypothetical protein
MKYCQCTLEKPTETGFLRKVTYIPAKFAVLGKVIKLKQTINPDFDDDWEDGWVVKNFGEAVDEKHLPDSHAEIKAHRRATGDALPKRNNQ